MLEFIINIIFNCYYFVLNSKLLRIEAEDYQCCILDNTNIVISQANFPLFNYFIFIFINKRFLIYDKLHKLSM